HQAPVRAARGYPHHALVTAAGALRPGPFLLAICSSNEHAPRSYLRPCRLAGFFLHYGCDLPRSWARFRGDLSPTLCGQALIHAVIRRVQLAALTITSHSG